MIEIKTANLRCPQCGELAPQKIVRQPGQEPLVWCALCHMVTIVECDLSLPIDPLTLPPAMSVQVAALDADHERLVDILNNLHAAAKAGQRDRLVAVSGQFLGDLVQHFESEEILLEAWGFPGLAEHRALHAALFKEMRALVVERLIGSGEELDELVQSIKLHLVGHLADDMKYKDHLAAGTKPDA